MGRFPKQPETVAVAFDFCHCYNQELKCNPVLAAVIVGIMMRPNWAALVAAGESVRFFGVIPFMLVSYTDAVIPIILVVFVQAYAEKQCSGRSRNRPCRKRGRMAGRTGTQESERKAGSLFRPEPGTTGRAGVGTGKPGGKLLCFRR